MHTTEHTDLDGDALTIHRDKGLAWITLTRGGEELTVGPVHATALAAHDHPGGLGASEWKILAETYGRDLERLCDDTELAEEFAALWKETARRAIQSERDQVDLAEQWATTARKAERERDEARGALRARLGVLAEARPLTPDAITDEMVERGEEAYRKAGGYLSFRSVHLILAAALTEPPARPEGAEELNELIGEYLDSTPGVDDKGMADFLAERGVRVVGEEQT